MQSTIDLPASGRHRTAAEFVSKSRKWQTHPIGDEPSPPLPPASDEPVEPEEPEEPDDYDMPCTDDDDARWDAFVSDDDERDPLPELGDFWVDTPADE